MSTPIIRDAVRGDAKMIAALLMELSRDEGKPCPLTEQKIETMLFTPQAVELRAIVCVVNNEIVGNALYYWGYDTLSESSGYHLADMVITHMHRRAGIGRALLAYLAAQVLREGGQWLSLTVLKSNEAARGFYDALGLTQVDVDFFAMGPSALMKLSG